ncbi:MAG: Dam family site-specific DNA-(adenine-N6)-methyltransferase [Oscillospiraceae bacterium]|nr:Dam family site-specific DNA-(adenine-N6)-methyltransferase [Oscillospiraceae bacterium]
MEYISAKEAAIQWGISQRRVAVFCSEDRIEGVKLMGKMWWIPKDARKPDDARSLRHQPKTPAKVKPFIKWAGGKAQILENIRLKYPKDLGNNINKYAEPFIGGGAVLFDILSNYKMSKVYMSDINHELIHTYTTIRDSIDELIVLLKSMEMKYLPVSVERRKNLYYSNRSRYNNLIHEKIKTPELAALFIFLNRTCFNGLYRVNSKGEFNVPQGDYKNPCICDEDNLTAVSKVLKNVQIKCCDYKKSKSFIDKNTFAYFDPPYRPLTESSSFTSYTQDRFGDKEQIELAQFIDILSDTGAFVVASNSDPTNINKEDSFFDKLYEKHKILRISAARNINSAANKRGKINELLIASY